MKIEGIEKELKEHGIDGNCITFTINYRQQKKCCGIMKPGLILHITVSTIEDIGGIAMETIEIFNGNNLQCFIAEMKRKNKKRLERAEIILEENKEKLLNFYYAKNFEGIVSFLRNCDI